MKLHHVTSRAMGKGKAAEPRSAQEQLADAMVRQAQEQGLALTGPDGLLKQRTASLGLASCAEDVGGDRQDVRDSGCVNLHRGPAPSGRTGSPHSSASSRASSK